MTPVDRARGMFEESGTDLEAMKRLPRVDLAVPGPWIVDQAYLDPPRHSPEHAWFAAAAAEYGVPVEPARLVLTHLSYGWSVGTALSRATLPPSEWNAMIAFLQRLVFATVLDRRS